MKVVLYGATGNAGSRIQKELLDRGHAVVAVSRNPNPNPVSGVTPVVDDASSVDAIVTTIGGADAVVSAIAPPQDQPGQLIATTQRLTDAIAAHGGPRLIVVGGAGSLFVAPGVTLIASGYLPEAWLAIAKAHDTVLEDLRKSPIDWTYFSPAAYFEPGERTGKFRLGKDDLIANAQNDSRISMEDYAIALVDELETPAHIRERFTISY